MEPIEQNSRQKNSWSNAKIKIYVNKNKSTWYKKRLSRKGCKDARRNAIPIEETEKKFIIGSVYIHELKERSNKKIEEVWSDCDYDMKDLKYKLEYLQESFDNLILLSPQLNHELNKIQNETMQKHYIADEEMSLATQEIRKNKRQRIASENINKQKHDTEIKIEQVMDEGNFLYTDYQSRELIAESQEETIIHDLKEDTYIYMRDTWKYINTPKFEVEPPMTTELPRKRHYKNFPRFCFSIEERLAQLKNKGE